MKQRTGVSRNLLKHKVTGKGESAFYEQDVRGGSAYLESSIKEKRWSRGGRC
jgi:hypothetical protein